VSGGGFRFHVVAHTHWDREWYLPLEHFRLELAGTVDEVLETLETDERFRSFTLDGQAVLIEDYLELRPENEKRLRALFAERRLVAGPSYVLPDELLVGSEALVRNLVLGRAVCERYGATPSGAGYMPDSFGHPAQLPQVLAGFGIGAFLFSRGVGDEVGRVGRVFRWETPDGSDVIAYNLLGHYCNAALLQSSEDLAARGEALAEVYGPVLERAGVRSILLLNGCDHLPIERRLPELLPDARYSIGSMDEFLADAHPTRPRAYRGELIGGREQNALRGVNSARMYIKQANEHAERHLLAAETAAALATLAGVAPFPDSDFRFAWRELLRNHPHDSICGCSADEVHDDMMERYVRLERTTSVLARKATAALSGGKLALTSRNAVELLHPAPSRSPVLWNTLPFARRRLVRGAVVHVPAFGGRRVTLKRVAAIEPRRRRVVENDLFRVEARADGTLAVTDHVSGRTNSGLLRFDDDADAGDLYTFCPVEGARTWRSDKRGVERSARALRDGPVSELEVVVDRRIRTRVRLVEGIERIELEIDVDNRTRDHRLRVAFAAPEAGDTVRAESLYALVTRPARPPRQRVPWHEPPALTQHSLGATAYGDLAVFTRGLPEIEARDSELLVTLLRCVGAISREGLATRPGHAGPPTPTPRGQCLGRHRFELAVRFGALSLGDAGLLRASQDYRFDFVEAPDGTPVAVPLVVEGDLVVSALKGAEDGDGVILRVFNPGRRAARLRVGVDAEVTRCRLDETPLPGSATSVGPGEISSFRLRPLRSEVPGEL
jgi:alpha-mannosidase